jgi:uncharacterized phage protein (TIGR01671 family)
MREILFRGKTLTNRWVEGAYYKQEYFYGDKEDAHIIITSKENLTYDQELDFCVVIPETVGQFTGLTDKNGNKIFEGDIIKIYLYEPKGLANYEVGCIKYDNTKARFVFCTKEGNYSIDNSNAFEVIGNIHDNPELLKGGAE